MKLFGKNQVKERLKAYPHSIKKIYFQQGLDLEALKELAKQQGISCGVLNEKDFFSMARHHHSQGVIAEVEEFVYANLEDFLVLPDNKKYTLIALSNITDPQNVGSIIRTAACFGEFALIIPKHRNVCINETVLKVACGGENYVPVIQVTNLVPLLQKAKDAGYWVFGSVVEGGQDITECKFSFPLCIVIGSEDKGIRDGILPHLDQKITLPMPGEALSLNAAVAAAILCYEVIRQRKQA